MCYRFKFSVVMINLWLKNKAVKAGLSVTLCILVSNLLELKYPFFAALPAAMPISSDLGETMRSGVNRMIGSTIGALVGIAIAIIQPSNYLFIWIGIVVIIYLCKFINWESSASIACLIFISIMISYKGEPAIIYSLHRLLATFIGIAITTVVDNLLLAFNMYSTIMKRMNELYESVFSECKNKICYKTEAYKDLFRERINTLENLVKVYKGQITFSGSKESNIEHLNFLMNNYQCILEELSILRTMENTCIANRENTQLILNIFNYHSKNEEYVENDINIVYNYHLARLLKGLYTIDKYLKRKGAAKV